MPVFRFPWRNPENDVADIIHTYCDRIAFAHIRNLRHYPNGDFSEVSHRDCDGDTGILEIMRAYHDCGYTGYVRPDHGRHLWEKNPTAGRDTVCMTGHSVSCTSGDAGICWNVWNRIPVSYAPFLLMQNKHVFYDHHSSHLFLV